MNVTIKDIAKALNVSKSTVSRAFLNTTDVGLETKQLIRDYAKKINYTPNLAAAGLKKGRSRSIGLIVSHIANSFFSQVISGVEAAASSAGYGLIITQSCESQEREISNLQQLRSHAIDGLLVSLPNGHQDLSYVKEWHGKGMPVVLYDKVSKEINTHKVVTDNFKGAFDATEHLIMQGFKQIAHLTGPAFLSTTVERLEGYKAALQKYKLPFYENLVYYFTHDNQLRQQVETSLQYVCSSEIKSDAILAATESTTINCFQGLKKLGKEKRIGLVGFSNNELCDSLTPAVSVVRQPAYEIGKLSMELLISLIENDTIPAEFETTILSTELIIRQSSLK